MKIQREAKKRKNAPNSGARLLGHFFAIKFGKERPKMTKRLAVARSNAKCSYVHSLSPMVPSATQLRERAWASYEASLASRLRVI